MTAAEKYLNYLNSIFEIEPIFYNFPSLIDGLPSVTAIIYKDIPEAGMITAFTYGLSLFQHPDWKLGRPELCICVDSTDVSWGRAAGFLANQGRGKTAFCYGDTINFRAQIADESLMDAFLIFTPSTLKKELYADIDIGTNYKIHIAGLYPIYSSEIEVCHRIGLKAFWHHPDFDLYNVNRPVIS